MNRASMCPGISSLAELISSIDQIPSFWDMLSGCPLPIVLYGMGDGADKSLEQCRRHRIPVAAVFASDDFVRGQQYQGFSVKTLSQVEAELECEFLILLCFATERPEVLAYIDAVAERHSLLVPDFPVFGNTLVTPDFIRAHAKELTEVESLLADDLSRKVLRDVLMGKLTGNPQMIRRCETSREEMMQHLQMEPNAVFVDAGAYTGDTVEAFVKSMRSQGKRFQRIVALEPDRRNYTKLEQRARTLSSAFSCIIDCYQMGVWNGPGALPFEHRSSRRAALGEGSASTTIPVDSIDHILGGDRAALIKYDVEGAELQALTGSTETIRRWRPALSIAAYHRGEDLFSLPLLLRDIRPDYNLYLRHHPYLPAWETIYYAF